jgi:outer membrane receptor protein involved in Fe transport
LKSIFLALFVLFIGLQCHAQSTKVYPDAGAWNTLSLDFVLNKKWTILFAEELRMRENYSRVNLFYTNLGMEYKINKNFKTSLVYRWINKVIDDNSISFRHRLMWDFTGKLPFKQRWSIAYRHRLQMEFRDVYADPNGKIPEWYSRNKVELAYQITEKLSASLSAEFRYQIYNRRFEASQHTWHRMRFQGGVDYKLDDNNKFGAYYLIQREFNLPQPQRIYITGLEYAHRFILKKQKL